MHTMHLLPSVEIQPNLDLKTWPKQLLGSLLLVIELPGGADKYFFRCVKISYRSVRFSPSP